MTKGRSKILSKMISFLTIPGLRFLQKNMVLLYSFAKICLQHPLLIWSVVLFSRTIFQNNLVVFQNGITASTRRWRATRCRLKKWFSWLSTLDLCSPSTSSSSILSSASLSSASLSSASLLSASLSSASLSSASSSCLSNFSSPRIFVFRKNSLPCKYFCL